MSHRFDRPVLVVQHTEAAHAGTIPAALAAAGATADIRRLFDGAPPPAEAELGEYAAVIVLGGAMNTDQDDAFPWLAVERDLIVSAVRRGTPLLGICLGAQQLARAFGGSVYQRDVPEVGWLPIEITRGDGLLAGLASPFEALEWHAQSFTAPREAVVLALRADDRPGTAPPSADGEVRDVQAFRLGDRAWGLQFHPEVDEAMIDAWLEQDNKGLRQRDPSLWRATHDARHDIVRRSRDLCRTLIANFAASV